MGSKLLWSRRGHFKLNTEFIEDDQIPLLQLIFKDVIVIHSEHDLFRNEIRYQALSTHFDSLSTGSIAPEYRIEVLMKEGDDGKPVISSVSWVRVREVPHNISSILTIIDSDAPDALKVGMINRELATERTIFELLNKTKAEV